MILLVLVLLFTILLSSFGKDFEDQNKKSIVVTFYVLEEFSKEVVGEKISVTNLTHAGIEPHDYEPSPQDIINIQNADLFIASGGGLDLWSGEFSVSSKGEYILMSDLIKASAHSQAEQSWTEDPHFWMDPQISAKIVQIIADKVSTIDPENESYYQSNAKEYIASLNDLDNDFATGLEKCLQKKIVVSHNAFSYLARSYGVEIVSIAGVSSEEEPSAKTLAGTIDFVKNENIQYIFTGSSSESGLASTIAKETGADILELNNLETSPDGEKNSDTGYIGAMNSNLFNLRIAMQCQ